MSATIYLFATKDVVDAFRNQLDRAYGKSKWRIPGNEYSDGWGTPPRQMKLQVENMQNEKIGHIVVSNRYRIEEMHDGPSLQAVPEKIEAFDNKGKQIVLYPHKQKISVTIEMEIEFNDELTVQEAIDVVTQEMDYDFRYSDSNVQIVRTEITDTNE